MSNNTPEFKIAMLAPTRIGKTSLVTAILQDTKTLLTGTTLSIKPKDGKTSARINQHMNELRGSLRERDFDTGAVQGTRESFQFNLSLSSAADEAHGLDIKLLDFPGDWLSDSLLMSGGGTQGQRESGAFIKDASVLLLVVDASLVMEVSTLREKRAVDRRLAIYATGEVVEEWCKARQKQSDKPSLLLICPVKCESYFNDNGGRCDKSGELFNRIMELYKDDVIDKVYQDGPKDAEILYMPVDTIGCVDFLEARWDFNFDPPSYSPSFRVRSPGRQHVVGANDILLAVVKQLFRYQEKERRAKAAASVAEAEEARRRAEDKGFFESVWSFFGGTTDNEAHAALAEKDAEEAIRSAETVKELIAALGHKKFGSRVKVIRSTEVG